MQRYLYPGIAYVAAAIVLAANWTADPMTFGPATIAGGLIVVSSIWWVAVAASGPRPLAPHLVAALLPAIPPLALSVLALRDTDAAILSILMIWPLTILPPAASLIGLLALGLRMAAPRSEAG